MTLSALILPQSAAATNGVECALSVHQFDQERDDYVLLWADTSLFVDSVNAAGFLVAFSADLQFIQIDTGECAFIAHLVTLGNPANNYSRQFRTEYGLPARIDGIIGKGGAQYSLTVTPLKQVDIDTAGCSYDHHQPNLFKPDPTGYMDIYYVVNSFGDFYWNAIKAIFEERYRLFMGINNFTLPGKYLVYLCPCPMYSVIWDKRFGTSVDPTRNVAFTIYNNNLNTADPFVVIHSSIYRNYGYAPAFLSEGLAGYLSLGEYRMKEMVRDGRALPLESLLDTYAYFTADASVADKTSTTFVKYLVNQHGIDKFLKLYRQADDLNLRSAIGAVYGKSVAELESEWLNWVDTVEIRADQFRFYRDLAEAGFDFEMMATYGQEVADLAQTESDSAMSFAGIVRSSFYNGDYYKAVEWQQKLVKIRDTVPTNWMSLASYQMMSGAYADVAANLDRAQALDSSNQLISFNRAMYALSQEDEKTAIQLLTGIILNTHMGGSQSEARVLLGNILAQSDNADDQALGSRYCMEALNALAQVINAGATSPVPHIWTGIGYLGVGDTGNAQDFLQTALHLERRPFYVGLISLWLGKVADVRGEHDVARDYYGYVLSISSADYHQKEARKYMDQPYQQ